MAAALTQVRRVTSAIYVIAILHCVQSFSYADDDAIIDYNDVRDADEYRDDIQRGAWTSGDVILPYYNAKRSMDGDSSCRQCMQRGDRLSCAACLTTGRGSVSVPFYGGSKKRFASDNYGTYNSDEQEAWRKFERSQANDDDDSDETDSYYSSFPDDVIEEDDVIKRSGSFSSNRCCQLYGWRQCCRRNWLTKRTIFRDQESAAPPAEFFRSLGIDVEPQGDDQSKIIELIKSGEEKRGYGGGTVFAPSLLSDEFNRHGRRNYGSGPPRFDDTFASRQCSCCAADRVFYLSCCRSSCAKRER